MRARRVAVIGGGLAGLAAALECAEAGAEVSLFEARSRLGGATFSVERNGYWLDNGQHVALRCCTEYLAFLRRLGVENLVDLQPRLRIPVLAGGGRRATLTRSSLPAPLHLAGTLLRYSHLSLAERLAAGRATASLRRLDPDDPALDEQTFGGWLRAHGQSERAIDALWNLIVLPALNLSADDASLALATKVFRTGLLDAADGGDVAVPRVPLQRLHAAAAKEALERLGARVSASAPIRSVEPQADGYVLRGDDLVEPAEAVVVAVPHDDAPGVLPPGLLDESRIAGLGASPIVNLHLHFDRRVLEEPFAAAVGSPVQWLFDRTGPSGVEEGQLVAISLSDAGVELGASQAELRERYLAALTALLPEVRSATLLDFAVTRQPNATFRAVPGTRRLRPGPQTALPGLYLAGAWTDTGWPATMEGAVRSGLAAARLALHDRRGESRAELALETVA
ncbi:MAG TPA: hydroxysqualene dehydroxylase HpnE [Gaiella sp.]|nr:hydroxysqualene dehydroxylase HpnE [Gaiella sp.]